MRLDQNEAVGRREVADAAGLEHALEFGDQPRLVGHVLIDLGADQRVEARVGERNVQAVAELEAQVVALEIAARMGDGPLVDVDADDFAELGREFVIHDAR